MTTGGTFLLANGEFLEVCYYSINPYNLGDERQQTGKVMYCPTIGQ
jgi:hypothetical protein